MKPRPRLIFNLWCLGVGDTRCAADPTLPMSRLRRLFWQVRGFVLRRLFGWWEWEGD